MIKNDKNEETDEGKEAECIDDTFPGEMEECVYDRNNNKNEKYDDREKEGETIDSDSTTMDEGKGVINERGVKDVDLDEFDKSTCSGDRYYDIFDKEEEIITDASIFCVNTNRNIW